MDSNKLKGDSLDAIMKELEASEPAEITAPSEMDRSLGEGPVAWYIAYRTKP